MPTTTSSTALLAANRAAASKTQASAVCHSVIATATGTSFGSSFGFSAIRRRALVTAPSAPAGTGYWSRPHSELWTQPFQRVSAFGPAQSLAETSPVVSPISPLPSNSDSAANVGNTQSTLAAFDASPAASSQKSKEPSEPVLSEQSSSPPPPPPPPPPASPRTSLLRLIAAFGLVAVTAVALDQQFNNHVAPLARRRSRPEVDAQESEYARQYVRDTFAHVGVAMVVSAGTAYAILSTRVGTRFVQRRLVWAGSFALMSGLTYATVLTRPTPPLSIHEALLTAEIPHPSKKQLLLLATAAAKGLFISSTLALRKSPLLTQTALAAAASVLAVAYTGATARSQHYVYIAAPALAGVAVAATALAVPPVGVGAWGLLLGYGAVASFTGCVVRDVAKIVKNAGKAGEESSAPHQGDVVSEAVWVYVDIMNVFSMF